uniref:Uncharacterized protein n=1 Tax=Arundo donax TaxID=35708 RepID=A0A0A9GIL8_ARUDO
MPPSPRELGRCRFDCAIAHAAPRLCCVVACAAGRPLSLAATAC